MIGLGSNRLSVCRRGGMSVTQAGRGGMEWLAGNGKRRESPYSAQATAALKAQFPTQWPTILDYGFAHPEIVPYVNQYPVGWGNIIVGYQLCEYIQATGTQYLKIPFAVANGFDIFNAKFTPIGGQLSILSAWTSGSGQGFNIDLYGNWRFWLGFANGAFFLKDNFTGLSLNSIVDLKYDRASGILNVNGQSKPYTQTTMPTLNYIYAFALGFGDSVQSNFTQAKMHEMHFKNTAEDVYPFPCYRKSDGVRGMYDVAKNEFYTNAGTGTFLKGSDIYYPGQTSPS